MAESAKALGRYVVAVGKAYAPSDMRRVVLALGAAAIDIAGAVKVETPDALVKSLAELVRKGDAA